MGPLRRIAAALLSEYLEIRDAKYHDGILFALDVVKVEYDKYHKPKCKQEQLALPLKENK